ncbi:MAG: hypothetical protein A2017_15315 [Lentisphaerae bacterium GWF2_44_16]|nr:MAG: hypothetical protein A2017_15315 [Lentisphaerae bacterium GWF2_44_16]
MNKYFGIIILAALFITGCNSTFMPPADPNMSDLTKEQIQEISKRKIHVPCRVEVHCPESLVGQRNSTFFTNYYYYPLNSILTNSFRSAAYQVFDPAGGEVIDAFTMHITVPESNLDVAWGKANYHLHVILKFNEPGEKKITALSIQKHIQVPFPNDNVVPEAVYSACRDAAYEAMKELLKNPKLWATIKRFEDR